MYISFTPILLKYRKGNLIEEAIALMVQEALPTNLATAPDIKQLVLEDDTPMDNFRSAKHQRLLTAVLYSFWLIPTGMVQVWLRHTSYIERGQNAEQLAAQLRDLGIYSE